MYFLITRFVKWDGDSALKAFCDIAIDHQLLIRGIRVIEGRKGTFVSMPRQQSKDQRWYDVVVPLTRETKVELSRVILEEFQKHRS
ncbi:MAG: septation protein SpoVG family protein [Candidatus Omnitrophica bacterium]|nr:septation protein SpoVG family protein [Candidatus Omnitrophota bacterium]